MQIGYGSRSDVLNWIADILEPDEIKTITRSLAGGEFTDGRQTAGSRAKRVKRNLQLRKNPAQAAELNELVIGALERNQQFRMIAIPKRVHRPLFSRYQEGMHYGRHVDDALMDKPNTLRTDIAVTVFLNDPEQYDGGELLIETSLGEQMIKLPRGDAIIYPASTLHSVAPVTRGERLAAVTWVQSSQR